MRLRTAAALLAAMSALASCTDPPPPGESSAPPTATASTRAAPAPPSLDDLPQGPAPRLAYLVGWRLVVGERTLQLEARPTGLVQAGSLVVLRYEDGRIVRLDTATSRSRVLTSTSSSVPVIAPGGGYVAWQTARPGQAEVAIRHLTPPFESDEQIFPATPSCCDNPFYVHGMTQLGHLFVSWPAGDQAWVWDVSEGQEGVPYLVPDSDDYVREVHGLGRGHISQVTANEIVVMYPTKPNSTETWVSVGEASDGSFEATESIPATAADFSDPRARRIVYLSRNGHLHISDRTSGLNPASHPEDHVVLDLGPRPVVDLQTLQWEDTHRFLVEVADRSGESTIRHALVRCNAKTRTCELAARLGRDRG